jgi:hypothetical protein
VCNLYSITTNQAAIAALFRVVNRYVGNLAPMPGVFPDYPAPVVRNTETGRELSMMRWGMPPPPRTGGPPVTNIRNTSSPHSAVHRSYKKVAAAWKRGVHVGRPLRIIRIRWHDTVAKKPWPKGSENSPRLGSDHSIIRDGRKLVTLRDAGYHFANLPKNESDLPEWFSERLISAMVLPLL